VREAVACETAAPMRFVLIAAVIALAACDGRPATQAKKKPSLKPALARIEATLELPSGDGRVHIIAVPTDFMEITRCIVAVGPNGAAAVSCAPKGFDMPADE